MWSTYNGNILWNNTKVEKAKIVEILNRDKILLKATHDVLDKCNQSGYVINPMEVDVFYDNADCDGYCLMNDIAEHLDL